MIQRLLVVTVNIRRLQNSSRDRNENTFRELWPTLLMIWKCFNTTKDRRSSGFCSLQHFNLNCPESFYSVQQSKEEISFFRCGIGVVGCAPLEDSGKWKCGQSLHLRVCGFELLGKDFECAHTKPSPSPSVSIFPSLPSSLSAAVFLSWLGTGAKLFFPSSLRHKQELTDLLTYTNTHSFCFPLPCPTLIWPLTLYWFCFGLQT